MKFGKFIKRTAEVTAVVAAGAYVYGKVKKYEKEIDVDDVPKAVFNDIKESAKVRINEVVDIYNDISNEFKESADDFINYKEIDKDFEDAAMEMSGEVEVETETEEEAEEEEEEPESDSDFVTEQSDLESDYFVKEAETEDDFIIEDNILQTIEPESEVELENEEDKAYGLVDENEIEEPFNNERKEVFETEIEDEETVEFQVAKDEDLESRNQYINSIRNFFPYVNKNLIENVYQQKDVISKSYKPGLHVKLYHLLSFASQEDLDAFIKILDKHNYQSEITGDGLQVEIINEMRIREGALLTDIYVVANQAGVLNGNYESFSIEEIEEEIVEETPLF